MSAFYLQIVKYPTLTSTRAESTTQNVPDLPIPALQCMIGGPVSVLSADGMAPDCLTAYRNARNDSEFCGIPKSGQST